MLTFLSTNKYGYIWTECVYAYVYIYIYMPDMNHVYDILYVYIN